MSLDTTPLDRQGRQLTSVGTLIQKLKLGAYGHLEAQDKASSALWASMLSSEKGEKDGTALGV